MLLIKTSPVNALEDVHPLPTELIVGSGLCLLAFSFISEDRIDNQTHKKCGKGFESQSFVDFFLY